MFVIFVVIIVISIVVFIVNLPFHHLSCFLLLAEDFLCQIQLMLLKVKKRSNSPLFFFTLTLHYRLFLLLDRV